MLAVRTNEEGSGLAKAVHAMVRVLDEARSVDFYGRAFGLAVAERIDFESFTLVYLKGSEADFEVELTVNKGRTEPYDLGDGYGNIAFVVDDLGPSVGERVGRRDRRPDVGGVLGGVQAADGEDRATHRVRDAGIG